MAQATKNGPRATSSAKGTTGGGASSNGTTASSGSNLSELAEKARVPAIAGGAALAGLASGLALSGRRDGTKKVLGMTLPAKSRTQMATKNLAEAAKQAGSFGDQLAGLATEIRKVREGFEARESRSPVEVLLQGLTRRGER